MTKCRPKELRQASPSELTALCAVLAPQMRYKQRLDKFIQLDLLDSIAVSGYILLTKSGEKMIENRRAQSRTRPPDPPVLGDEGAGARQQV